MKYLLAAFSTADRMIQTSVSTASIQPTTLHCPCTCTTQTILSSIRPCWTRFFGKYFKSNLRSASSGAAAANGCASGEDNVVPATAEEAAAGMLMRCWRLRGLTSQPSTGVGAKGWISSGLPRQALADRHGRRHWAGSAEGCCGRPSPASTSVGGTGSWLLWLALTALDCRGRDRRLAGCCRPSLALKGVGGDL